MNIQNLKKNGYIKVQNIFNDHLVTNLKLNCTNIINNIRKKNALEPNMISDNAKMTVSEMEEIDKSVFSDRRKSTIDNGMIDIFNPEKINNLNYQKSFQEFRDVIRQKILPLMNVFYKKKFKLGATNIYHHFQTTNPRPAHYDSEIDYFKIFLFLSNVDNAEGSFFIYEGSHEKKFKKKLMNRVNKFFLKKKNLEDINFIFSDKTKKNLIGNIGDAYITNVSCLHGSNKFFNDSSMERLVLVQRVL